MPKVTSPTQVNDTAEFRKILWVFRGIATTVVVLGGAAVAGAAYLGWRYAVAK
jgi:hypothetical protein